MDNCFSHVNFYPWVGKNYNKGILNGKKVLILGESHYCKDELTEGGRCFPCCDQGKMSKECHNQTILNECNGKAFTTFERAVYGRILTQQERDNFWEGVVFYNYFQYSQPRPRCLLNQSKLEDSELAFKEILEKYIPDYIIAWGFRLYDLLPDWKGTHSEIIIGDDKRSVWTYHIGNKDIPVLSIEHPSSGMSWEYCHQFIKEFLSLKE